MTSCSHCGDYRDPSNRYTSPANVALDVADWKRVHESGLCVLATDEEVAQVPEEFNKARYGGKVSLRDRLFEAMKDSITNAADGAGSDLYEAWWSEDEWIYVHGNLDLQHLVSEVLIVLEEEK